MTFAATSLLLLTDLQAALIFETDQFTICELLIPPQTSKGSDTTGVNTFLWTVLEGQPGSLLVEIDQQSPRHMSTDEKFTIPPYGTYNITNVSRCVFCTSPLLAFCFSLVDFNFNCFYVSKFCTTRSTAAHLHLYIIPRPDDP